MFVQQFGWPSRKATALASLLALGAMQAGRAVAADEPEVPSFSYVFVNGGYEDRHTEDEGQFYRGPGFGASINLGTYFFLDADYAVLRSRSFERTGAAPSSGGLPLPPSGSAPTVTGRLENESWSVGLGAHAPLSDRLDFTLSGSYLRNHLVGIDGFSDDNAERGWSASTGLRLMLLRWFEVNGGASYSRLGQPGSNHYDSSTAPYAGAAINFNRTWSIAASHSWLKTSRDTAITLRASFDTRNNK